MVLPNGKYLPGDVVYPLAGRVACIVIDSQSGPHHYNVRYLNHPSMDDAKVWELGEQALDQHRLHGYMERDGKHFESFVCPVCGGYLQVIEHGSYRGTYALDVHGTIMDGTFHVIQRVPMKYGIVCAKTDCSWEGEFITLRNQKHVERKSS